MTTTAQRLWRSSTEDRHALHGLAVLRIGYGVTIIGLLLANVGDWQLLWGPGSPWRPEDLRAVGGPGVVTNAFLLGSSPAWATSLLLALLAGAATVVLDGAAESRCPS